MRNNLISLFFIFAILSGCSTLTAQGMKPRTVEDYYSSTGVEKYFLSDIPRWANFDQVAGCYRSSNIRYFDLDAMMKSYGLSYSKALQVQASYNEEMATLKGEDKSHTPTLKEEELLFSFLLIAFTDEDRFFFFSFDSSLFICSSLHSSLQNGVSPLLLPQKSKH